MAPTVKSVFMTAWGIAFERGCALGGGHTQQGEHLRLVILLSHPSRTHMR